MMQMPTGRHNILNLQKEILSALSLIIDHSALQIQGLNCYGSGPMIMVADTRKKHSPQAHYPGSEAIISFLRLAKQQPVSLWQPKMTILKRTMKPMRSNS